MVPAVQHGTYAAFSGNPPKFGNSEATPPLAGAEKTPVRRLGLIKAAKIMREHLQHADNREEIKALSQAYLPRVAKYGVALVPFGFLLAGPVDWWTEKYARQGEDKIDQLIAQGKLNPDNGPLGCVTQIKRNWQSALDRKGRLSDEDAARALLNIRDHWNKLADHLFPDDPDGISLVREKLKLRNESAAFFLIGRAFHANRDAKVRFCKKFARKASSPILGIFLKPVRWLMLGLGLLYQGVLMLENGPVVKKLLQQAVRRVA